MFLKLIFIVGVFVYNMVSFTFQGCPTTYKSYRRLDIIAK